MNIMAPLPKAGHVILKPGSEQGLTANSESCRACKPPLRLSPSSKIQFA